jgi:hypothetical protein
MSAPTRLCWWRGGLLAAAILPLAITCLAYAQLRGPGGPLRPGGPAGGGRPPGSVPGGPLVPGGPGMAGGGEPILVFSCTKCGAELGTGRTSADRPNLASCPVCGVRFVNTPTGRERNGGGPGIGIAGDGNDRPAGNPTKAGPDAFPFGAKDMPDISALPPDARAPSSSRDYTTVIVVVVVLLIGLLLILGLLGGVVWMVSTAPRRTSGGQAKRRRRSRSSDFDSI